MDPEILACIIWGHNGALFRKLHLSGFYLLIASYQPAIFNPEKFYKVAKFTHIYTYTNRQQ